MGTAPVQHLVVNGAFNQGNSGGPLITTDDKKLVGVVVAKHAPLTPFQRSALDVMQKQRSGVVYTARDENGTQHQFTQAQLVADLLNGLLELTQVMIGEAVAVPELVDFLAEQKIAVPWDK